MENKFFVSLSEEGASYPEEALIDCFKNATSDIDVYIVFEDVHNKFIVPTLCSLYELLINNTKCNISLIPKQGKAFGQELAQKKVELKSFDSTQYNISCVGGTFDHMHAGHKLLLTTTALVTKKKVMIGVTRKASRSKKIAELIYPLHKRTADVIDFMFKVNEDLVYSIEVIDDVAGPVGKPGDIDILVLSEETRKGAEEVKKLREERGLKPINYLVIPLIIDQKSGEKISSTQIRVSESLESLSSLADD